MDATLAFGYSGAFRDPIIGGYALGNGYRMYLPELMRFSAPDDWSPFGEGGIHPYVYCAADPINQSDPSGHFNWGLFTHIVGDVFLYGIAALDVGAGIAGAAFTGGASIAASVAIVGGIVSIATGIAAETVKNSKAKLILNVISVGSGFASGFAGAKAFEDGLEAWKTTRMEGFASANEDVWEIGTVRHSGGDIASSGDELASERAVTESESAGTRTAGSNTENPALVSRNMQTVDPEKIPLPVPARTLRMATKAALPGSVVGGMVAVLPQFFEAPLAYIPDENNLFRSENPCFFGSSGPSEYGNPFSPNGSPAYANPFSPNGSPGYENPFSRSRSSCANNS